MTVASLVGGYDSPLPADSLIGDNLTMNLRYDTTLALMFSGQLDHAGGSGASAQAQAYFVIDGVTYWGGPVAAQRYANSGGAATFNLNMAATHSLAAGSHTFNVWVQTDRSAWTYHHLSLIVMAGSYTGESSLISGESALL